MTKTTKKVFFAILFLLLFAVLAFSMTRPGIVAYAGEKFAIVEQPTNLQATYDGKVRKLNVQANIVGKNVHFQWAKGETATSIMQELPGETQNTLDIRTVEDSGYYFCKLSLEIPGATTQKLESNKVSVKIMPKPIVVEVKKKEFVYNGEGQRPILAVNAKEIVAGDKVMPEVKVDKITKDAGEYEGQIYLPNKGYTIKGEKTVKYKISKAPLNIKIQELSLRVGQKCNPKLMFEGFQGSDDETCLGFTPQIPNSAYNLSEVGIYPIICTGESETKNYKISYPKGYININNGELAKDAVNGINATATGSFRKGTRLEVSAGTIKPMKFNFLQVVKHNYKISFVDGKADGNTYILNIEDPSISKFMLSVCVTDEKGNTKKVENFSHDNGVLSVTLPTDLKGDLIIYNNYTLIAILGAVLLLIVIILIIVMAKSRGKYRKQKFYCEGAQRASNDAYERLKDDEER